MLEEFSRSPELLDGLVRPQVRGIKFGGARYRVEFGSQGEPKRAAVRLGRVGTVPVFAPSMAMNHEVIRQAILHNGRSGSMEIPVYEMLTGGNVVLLTVSWTSPDTAIVAYPSPPGAYFLVDPYARVLGSRTPDGEYVTERLR